MAFPHTLRRRRGLGVIAAAFLGLWAGGAPKDARAVPPVYAQLAGGLAIFPGDSRFDTGAAYGVSLGWRATPALAVEVGYLGAVFTTEPSAEAAIEHGGYAAAVVAPIDFVLSPYGLAGVELSHRRAAGEEEPDAVRPGTFVRLPLGLGVDGRLGLFTIGVRGTYDLSLREGREGGPAHAGDRVVVTLRFGAEF
ncbi:MAG TPA: hypothetical protein VN033_14405 [Vulgatibacter sp.]|nr:hypothetical protein [Vulgatibacter sp.]